MKGEELSDEPPVFMKTFFFSAQRLCLSLWMESFSPVPEKHCVHTTMRFVVSPSFAFHSDQGVGCAVTSP